jgi:hypothetical protein
MDNYFYAFPVLFLIFASYYLFIGLRVTLINKPIIINSNWLYIFVSFSLLPSVVFSIINIKNIGIDDSYGTTLFMSIIPVFLIIMMVFYYFVIKGYSIYCITDEEFRKALLFSLNNNLIKFNEKFNKIELFELNNELNISFASWIGTGMIKLKNKKDKLILKKIIDDIKQYFKNNEIKTKKIMAIFYLIFGIVFIMLGIGFTIFMIRIGKYL